MSTVGKTPLVIGGLRASLDLTTATFTREWQEQERFRLDDDQKHQFKTHLTHQVELAGGFEAPRAQEYLRLFQGGAALFLVGLAHEGPPGSDALFGALEIFQHEQRYSEDRPALQQSGRNRGRWVDGVVGWNSLYDGGTAPAPGGGALLGPVLDLGVVGAEQKVVAQAHALDPFAGTEVSVALRVVSAASAAMDEASERLVFDPFTAPGAAQLAVAGEITDPFWRFEVTVAGEGANVLLFAALAVAQAP